MGYFWCSRDNKFMQFALYLHKAECNVLIPIIQRKHSDLFSCNYGLKESSGDAKSA